MGKIEPVLTIRFHVEAWIADGYGDNRSRDFGTEKEAVDYARSLDASFCPAVTKRITMQPISIRIPI